MKRIAVKVGSQVLKSDDGSPDLDRVSSLASGVSHLWSQGNEVFLISSGAIAWGGDHAGFANKFKVEISDKGKRGFHNSLRRQILASIGQALLISSYSEAFANNGRKVAQILVTRHDLADQIRYESLRNVVLNLLRLGIVPIFNENDVISSEEVNFGDNDQLACMLTTAFQADRLIMLSNVDGLFDRDPADPSANLITNVDDFSIMEGIDLNTASEGKGGIKSKLLAAEMVTHFGVEMIIANGKSNDILQSIETQENCRFTRFPARGVKLRQRKSWVALAALSKGDMTVSTFLAEILKMRRPASVLLIGVEAINGSFKRGDVVTVKDETGLILGRGEVRISSVEILERLSTRGEVSEIDVFGSEVIHCDYFVHAPS